MSHYSLLINHFGYKNRDNYHDQFNQTLVAKTVKQF